MSEHEYLGIDTDGDGAIDGVTVDTDGDGVIDTILTQDDAGHLTVLEDPDGSGNFDSEWVDTDGDGAVDIGYEDLNHDGQVGMVSMDLDGDGQIDEIRLDTDGDGELDTALIDSDGDAMFDTFARDLDGDGLVDVVEIDADGDGVSEVITTPGQTLVLDADGHVVEVQPNDGTSPAPGGDDWPADDDPGVDAPTDDEPVVDDGALTPDGLERESDSQYWFEQSQNGFCMPASVAMIVAEHSDAPITEEAFVERAQELGYLSYDETEGWSGMTAQQGANLLESFGVDCTVATGDVESLDQYLDQGYDAIVTIDSSVVWDGDGADVADHAVVVSSIENGMVYLNDPGSPEGQLEPVPVAVFEEAWSASGETMIITDAPDQVEVGAEQVLGTILLPIVLRDDDGAWSVGDTV